ncbi:MAG: rhodanese-like domain-containing protein [Alphaproteobacteria bacterium]|nr:rhodanese-like domain-containing protein [Alphaproteobacteria bacterium]
MAKNILIWSVLAVLAAVSIGFILHAKAPPAAYRKITPQQAKHIIDSGKPYILLDVRSDGEFKEAHITGARLIPHNEIEQRASSELSDKRALTLVYCLKGERSRDAAHRLVRMGYSNVYDFGGISDWPYQTVTSPKQ